MNTYGADQIKKLRDSLAMDVFGMTATDAMAQSICVACRLLVEVAKLDPQDQAEYAQSAFCPRCAAEMVPKDLVGKAFPIVVLVPDPK
jgi:uncharacterized paraquat-inducible protein A